MKSSKYTLTVYEPGSTDRAFAQIEAAAPFMAILPGTLIDPFMWEGTQSPMKILRVVNTEHVIQETKIHIHHLLRVYTEEVENSRELKFTGPLRTVVKSVKQKSKTKR